MFSLRDTKKIKRPPSASQFVAPSRRRLPYLITLVEEEEVKMGRIRRRLGRTPLRPLTCSVIIRSSLIIIIVGTCAVAGLTWPEGLSFRSSINHGRIRSPIFYHYKG